MLEILAFDTLSDVSLLEQKIGDNFFITASPGFALFLFSLFRIDLLAHITFFRSRILRQSSGPPRQRWTMAVSLSSNWVVCGFS